MVTRSVAERYAWGNCNLRLGRRPRTISRQQERSGSAFFCWHTASVTTALGNKDVEEDICVGVPVIPTFCINGRRLVGALPLESFVRVIQEELGRVR